MEKNTVCLPGMTQILGDKIWVSLLEVNGLVSVDMKTGEMEFVGKFPDISQEYMLHYHVVTYFDKIIFFPWNTTVISIYDLTKQEFRSVSLNKEGRIYSSILIDEIFYLISERELEIIEFDANDEKILGVYKTQLKYKYSPLTLCTKPFLEQGNICNLESNASWKFDMKRKIYTPMEDLEKSKIISVCESKNDIWILKSDLKLYQRKKDGEIERWYELCDYVKSVDFEPDNWTVESVFFNNTLMLVFQDIRMVLQIPKSDQYLELKSAKSTFYKAAFFSVQQNVMAVFEKNSVIVITEDGEREISLRESFEVLNKIIRESVNTVFMESNNFTLQLNNYIGQIVNWGNFS